MAKRINLIACPRNISTALMYSFAQRPDTSVVDEPFYGYYLEKTDANHPGKGEIIAAMETDLEEVTKHLLQNREKPVFFIKNMAHHHINLSPAFIDGCHHFFLIRHPKLLIRSFTKVIPNPTIEDIGVKKQYELFKMFQDKGHQPVVLDSGELLKDLPGMLKEVCKALGIPFFKEMLEWPAGARPEDGVWAKYWYHSVHQSTGFKTQPHKEFTLEDHLLPLLEDALPYYRVLFESSIK